MTTEGTHAKRLTENDVVDGYPDWSPDGTRIAFLSNRRASSGLYLHTMGVDGSDVRFLDDPAWLSTPSAAQYPPQWSPDSQRLAFLGSDGLRRHAIYTIDADGANREWVTDAVSGPSWSPDGQRLAFAKPDGNEVALYTIAADGSDAQRVTRITGWRPRYGEADPTQAWIGTVAWSPSGKHILHTCGPAICVVDLEEALVREMPLAAHSREEPAVGAWSPDGSRLAVVDTGPPTLNRNSTPVLRTMAPDGSEVRTLVVQDKEGRLQSAADLRQTDIAGCAAGTAVPNPAAHSDLVRDCETLLRARDALRGTAGLNWTSNRLLDRWEGVVVSGWPRRLIAISLNGRGLTGEIPPELAELTHLRRLELSGNRLGGAIPPEVGQLTRLARLDLSDNSLTGGIPPELGQLTQLARQDLRENELSGPIPAELGQLANLEELQLGGNELTGCIPAALQQVSKNDLGSLGLPACEQE